MKTAAISARAAEEPVFETIKISGDSSGNKRYPGVCENTRGDRLVIYRGADNIYWYSFYKKGGSWSKPASIPGQPRMENYKCVDVEADSKGRFHCVWEEPDVSIVYGSFKDGTWTTPYIMPTIGVHDMGVSIATRSNDEVTIGQAIVIRAGYLTKDIFFWQKGANESRFHAENMTRDEPSSTQPSIAVDDRDHIWMAYKTETGAKLDSLGIQVMHFNQSNVKLEEKVVTDPDQWNFWPQIAVNTDRKVMVTWALTQKLNYMSRLFDTEAKKWTEIIPVNLGIPTSPWAAFWSKMVAHDKDFYLAAMDPARVLHLLKFDEERQRWEDFGRVSKGSVEYFDLYSGYDKILIAWNSWEEPSSVYLTTMEVDPFSRARILSVANLVVERHVERGFFHGYYLNTLTWEANPSNVERELVITAHRIYRKARTESSNKWKRIAEVQGTVMKYEDRNIPADSDYVYAVTCVDDEENESIIE